MIVDRTKSSLLNFYALVKASNPGMTLTDLNAIVGPPEAGSFVNGNTTKVSISSIKNKGFSGTREVFYKRTSLIQGLVGPITSLLPNVGETAGQLGARILAALNVLEAEVTVNGGAGFTTSGNQVIATKPNSLIYLPGQSHTVAATPASTSQFRFVMGAYTSVDYKATSRSSRIGVGTPGAINVLDIDSDWQPTTPVGQFLLNPGNNCRSCGYTPTWAGTEWQVTFFGALPPSPTGRMTITNDETGASATITHAAQDTFSQGFTAVAGSFNPGTLGIIAGTRFGVSFI